MLSRATLYFPLIVAVLLLAIVAGLAYSSWLLTGDGANQIPFPIHWLAFFGLLLLSQVLVGYLIWWFLRKRQPPTSQIEVLHSIVHEFQSPITAIRMSVDILDSPIARNQPERTDKYLRIIREETERLQQQVETMLTLARADRNTLVLNPEPISLHRMMQSIAERHGNYLTLDLPVNDPHVLADRLHLTNVLHNLLDNAIKYSADEPEISLKTQSSSDGLTITVRDQGVGIAPKMIAQIFQPFYRVHDQNSPSVKGFGLGLSYVQRIVHAHNWTIWVQSELGRGSEFIIQIPRSAILPVKKSESAKE